MTQKSETVEGIDGAIAIMAAAATQFGYADMVRREVRVSLIKNGGLPWKLQFPYPPGILSQGRRYWEVSLSDGPETGKNMAKYTRDWIAGHRAGLLENDALAMFAGILQPDTVHGYSVDLVLRRILESRGSSVEDLLGRIREKFHSISNGYPVRSAPDGASAEERRLRDRLRTAFSTYSGTVPKPFSDLWYKRVWPIARQGLPEMQMRTWTKTRHLAADVALSDDVIWDGSSGCQLWIRGAPMPNTIYQGMRGRRLVEVVEHEALDIPELVVKRAWFDGKRTVIMVDPITEDVSHLMPEEEPELPKVA